MSDLVALLEEDIALADNLLTRANALADLTYLFALDKELTWPTR